jgi:hypothetical protein
MRSSPLPLEHNTPALTVRARHAAHQHAGCSSHTAATVKLETTHHLPLPKPYAYGSVRGRTSHVDALLPLELHTLQSPPQAASCVTAVLLATSTRLRSRSYTRTVTATALEPNRTPCK